MSVERFIFTATPGRSGSASLAEFLAHHVEGALVAFEEPQVRPHFGGALGDLERHFRRRFIETDELLGRGKVLVADARGDHSYIDRIVAHRLRQIERAAAGRGAGLYIDVNTRFVRGLCWGFARAVPRFSLIRLLRDPVLVMRSYLNRSKTFTKEHVSPGAPNNLLRLDPSGFAPGEFYLWSWCETYLRFDRLARSPKAEHAIDLHTDALKDPAAMNGFMDALHLPHLPARVLAPTNTNIALGYASTRVSADDVRTLDRFLGRLSPDQRSRLRYFDRYVPPEAAAGRT